MAPWKLPLVVAAIAVPIALAFALGGPGVGVAIGALGAVGLVAVAVRQKPRRRIAAAEAEGPGRHVLVVVTCAVEEPADVARIARVAGLDEGEDGEVLVLAPARIGFLDRWASDVEGARRGAQESLVATVAALAKAGIVAEARVGDEDVVQAVEDQLRSYPASEVVLVGGDSADDEPTAAAAEELAARLQPEFRHVALGSVGR